MRNDEIDRIKVTQDLVLYPAIYSFCYTNFSL